MVTRPKVEIKGINMGTGNRVLRTVKMLQPIHAECQFPLRKEWWKRCISLGHDPYISENLVDIDKPIYEEDGEGDLVLKDIQVKKKLVIEANVTQVPLAANHNDGKGVENARKKGCIDLEERGYNPMCQYRDCWLERTIVTPYGEYCGKEHARLIGALEEGVALEVLDRKKRARQLRDVETDL